MNIGELKDAQLIAGGTHLGMNVKNVSIPNLISVEGVRELSKPIKTEESWEIGAATTLTRVTEQIGREYPQIAKILRRFATRPIRNRATLGGYLATAGGSGQISPLLFALNARVILLSENGERDAPISQFYDKNTGTILAQGEVIRSVIIPRYNDLTLADRGITSRLCDTYTSGRRRTLTKPYVRGLPTQELMKFRSGCGRRNNLSPENPGENQLFLKRCRFSMNPSPSKQPRETRVKRNTKNNSWEHSSRSFSTSTRNRIKSNLSISPPRVNLPNWTSRFLMHSPTKFRYEFLFLCASLYE